MTETPNLDNLDASLTDAETAIDAAQDAASAMRELVDTVEPESRGLLGVSMSKWDHKTSTTPIARAYNRDDARLANDMQASVLLYNVGQTASASSIQAECQWLMDNYGPGRGSVQAVIMHKGNEVDRDDHLGSNPDGISKWIAAADEVQAACHAVPGCYHGINVTGWGIRGTGNAAKFKDAAPYLDVFTPNLYPPGRSDSPVVFTPYPDFIDECLDMAVDWGIGTLACGEWGIPVHPSNPDKRPEYVAGGGRYMADGCEARGLVFLGASYWDSVKLKNGQPDPAAPDNRFQNDGTRTSSAWYSALK